MTFLFDIGRVLLDFDFESSLARLLPPGATDGLERMTLLLDRKDEFETGSIPDRDYIPWAIERMGI
ncbi:MAG: HAD-superfamily hydrolase, subfamily variant 3, partial [Akkermansiaceae bacterium]|nr:HAD-superfamily hydrolase, subfamily variant 3 [Akkermansiaceae bacterium]